MGRKTKTETLEGVTSASVGRMTNKERVLRAWGVSRQVWPPALGAKVRLFQPKDHRGCVATVIATERIKLRKSMRLAPLGRVRVLYDGSQFTVGQDEVFPREMKLKELMSFCF